MRILSHEGLTFDDVLIVPRVTAINLDDIDYSTHLTNSIKLNTPIVSSAMETVTESSMAIAVARFGGLGVIHRNMGITEQAAEADKVKRSEHSIISNPFTLSPNQYVSEAVDLMKLYNISGIPITEDGNLVGILTSRDLRFEADYSKKVYELMTRSGLITAPEGITLEEAKIILSKYKVEKLPIVDPKGRLKGLITVKDINKSIAYPLSSRDNQGRLLVGASVGIGDDLMERVEALAAVHTDVFFLDIIMSNEHTAMHHIRAIKDAFPSIPLVAGNVACGEETCMLIEAGADAVKVGIGSSSVSTTRVITGVGMPQLTAVLDCAKAAKPYNIPIISDGGIRYSGDITKALAAGAHVCMVGNLLAGCDESPGTTEVYRGRKFKEHRGVRLYNTETPEGVEGRTPYNGCVFDVAKRLLGGLSKGMSYCGCKTISELHEHASFIKVTPLGMNEGHPHDIQITNDSINYNME